MGFGSLSVENAVDILLRLKGVAQTVAGLYKTGVAMQTLGSATKKTSAETALLNKNTWAHNQLLYTGRRLAFYGTLGMLGLVGAVAKLGFTYRSTMQQADVALQGIIPSKQARTSALNDLYKVAALSPFLFQNVTQAFRTMQVGFSTIGYKATDTIKLIRGITDALAVSGNVTEQRLMRAAYALQHMAFMGRLTGRAVQQLAMDGIPIFDILNKKFGVTGNQLHNIAKLGLPAADVLKAISTYLATNPKFAGAAARLSNQSLAGAWAQFKDIIAKGAGSAVGGPFNFLQKTLAGVNTQLQPLFMNNKPITLTNIAGALDKQLSPSTHIILNLFTLFNYAIKTLIITLAIFFKAIQIIIWPLNKIANLFGANNIAMTLLGITLGIGIGLWSIYQLKVISSAIAIDAAKVAMSALRGITILLMGTDGLRGLTNVLKGTSGWTETLALRMMYLGDSIKAKGLIGSIKAFGNYLLVATRRMFGFGATSETAGAKVGKLRMLLKALPVLTAITLAITLLIERKAVDRAVTGFLRGHHLGFLTGGKSNLFDTPYSAFLPQHGLPSNLGIFRKQITEKLQAHRGQFTAAQIRQLHNLGYPGFWGGGIFTRGGWATVGERGPELINLPEGSKVFNQAQAAELPGGGSFIIKVYPQNVMLDGEKVGTVLSTVVTSREARQ